MTRTVLVTGASGGIGIATVLEAGRRNWHVCAAVHTANGIERVRDAVEGLNVDIEVLDVCDESRCAEVVQKYAPTALVNNAGIGAAGAIEDVDVADARRALEVMAVAPMRIAKLALPHMRTAGMGRIVNVSSLAGRTSAPLTGWYVASKHALESLSDALRMELAGAGISVSVIEPGGVDTGILEKSVERARSGPASRFDHGYERAEQLTAMTHRFNGSTDKVARVIVDALESPSPKARYLVGRDARLMLAAGALTPSRVKDKVKRKLLKL